MKRLHTDMANTHRMEHKKKQEEQGGEASVCVHTKGTSVMHTILLEILAGIKVGSQITIAKIPVYLNLVVW